jgi:hypothetical protein
MPTKRPHPLYSRLGCTVWLLFIMVLGIVLFVNGGSLFSPGPLSATSPQAEPIGGFDSHAAFETACATCHVPWQGANAALCLDCHQAIGQQQSDGVGLHGRLPHTDRCTQCHTEHQGRQANINLMDRHEFDHDQLTTFSLLKHALNYEGTALLCQDCHREGRLLAATVDCHTCHMAADPVFTADHSALFGTECAACHDGLDSMADFDHQTVFVLDGAHATLSCQTCHSQQVFTGTPNSCSGCHQEPAVHAGLFGLDCARCHTTQAWTPAELTSHIFPLDHGDEGIIACQTCHERVYTTYTCYNCHEHEPEDIREEHEKEDIFEFANCVDCHPTGLEDEAERLMGGP